jgi:hypothetical protein
MEILCFETSSQSLVTLWTDRGDYLNDARSLGTVLDGRCEYDIMAIFMVDRYGSAENLTYLPVYTICM